MIHRPEDCGAHHEPIIRAAFGDAVADIVLACTDGTAEGKDEHTTPEAKKADWLRRKQAYLAHLAEAPDDVLLVSVCDKLHNARAVVEDLQDASVGRAVFSRFTGETDGTLRYYEALSLINNMRGTAAATRLEAVVSQMHVLGGAGERRSLDS